MAVFHGSAASSTIASRPTASVAGLSVLVVDDDDESRAIVPGHLEDHEAIVLEESSARSIRVR